MTVEAVDMAHALVVYLTAHSRRQTLSLKTNAELCVVSVAAFRIVVSVKLREQARIL